MLWRHKNIGSNNWTWETSLVPSKFQPFPKLQFQNSTISYLGHCKVGNTEINKMMLQVVFRQTKKSTMVTKQNREFSLSPIIAAKQKLLTFYVVVFQDCNLVMLRLLQNCILKEFVFNRSRFFFSWWWWCSIRDFLKCLQKSLLFLLKVEELSSLIRFDGFVYLFDWLRRVLFVNLWLTIPCTYCQKKMLDLFLRNVYFTSVIKRL